MTSLIIQYYHHARLVSVREDLWGKHRDHCLCFEPCSRFFPSEPERNCPKARRLFKLCVEEGMTTPVFECPDFSPVTEGA